MYCYVYCYSYMLHVLLCVPTHTATRACLYCCEHPLIPLHAPASTAILQVTHALTDRACTCSTCLRTCWWVLDGLSLASENPPADLDTLISENLDLDKLVSEGFDLDMLVSEGLDLDTLASEKPPAGLDTLVSENPPPGLGILFSDSLDLDTLVSEYPPPVLDILVSENLDLATPVSESLAPEPPASVDPGTMLADCARSSSACIPTGPYIPDMWMAGAWPAAVLGGE